MTSNRNNTIKPKTGKRVNSSNNLKAFYKFSDPISAIQHPIQNTLLQSHINTIFPLFSLKWRVLFFEITTKKTNIN
ncbi:hypothetical protein CEAn_00551 [Coxiella endosymbiont of Amblyomma nuttalli]|nr:hypothetical protein CEAn_00551 [Coxiella endosymbiont of Amblyomma nuttalli]